MSYSCCLKCGKMVGWYDKYCQECQVKFKLPDEPEWQRENSPEDYKKYNEWKKAIVDKVLTKLKN
ncbi:MAG: hypothetical protein HF967_08630 [Methanosarcinales archaeon]|nr:hypothetical protein [Methanosarcinales archaeon]